MNSWKDAIDEGARICGGQNALARYLSMENGWLSASKAGKRAIPREKLASLALLINEDPARLWDLMEIANLPRRNPFLHAASAVLSAFLCVVLSVGGNDAKADAYGAKSRLALGDTLYIVVCVSSHLRGWLAALGSSLAGLRPMRRHAV